MTKRASYSVKMKDLPLQERPRERLERLGSDSLSNAELISILIGVGSKKETVSNLANRLLKEYGLERLSSVDVRELRKIFGINNAKASRIVASFELGRRNAAYSGSSKPIIHSPEDIAKPAMNKMRNMKTEILQCVCLDSRCGILRQETVAKGSLNTNSIHARELFRPAILEAAAGIILLHNHPSGDPHPSREDIDMTKMVEKAGRLIGIELVDHIIIGNGTYVSMKADGLF